MNIRERIQVALEHAQGTPAHDVYQHLLRIADELGPGNEGLLHTYIREAKEALIALFDDIDGEAPRRQEARGRR